MEPRSSQETLDHEIPPTERQQPARAVPCLEATCHFPHRQSPPGSARRDARLDRTGAACADDSPQEAQEPSRPPAAPASAPRRDGADGRSTRDVPRGRGPDPVLRAGQVPVRADGDGLDARLHDGAGLHGADGRRRLPADQRVRRGAGCGSQARRSTGARGGHHCTRGCNSVPERDGFDGELRPCGDLLGAPCRPHLPAHADRDRRKASSGKRSSAPVPTARQQGVEAGQGPDGRRDGNDRRQHPCFAGQDAREGEHNVGTASRSRPRGAQGSPLCMPP